MLSTRNDERKKNIKSWIVNSLYALMFFLLTAIYHGLFQETDLTMIIRRLSDCFLIPGALLGSVSALAWIAAKGNFDMLAFGAKLFINMMIHPNQKQETYYEYKMRQEEKNPQGKWPWRTFVVGLVCLVISIVFAVVFEFVVS
ncbi:MAG: DUF3899 domain-containing protein [Lachnospiraceae bacterium]|nr:DUF3899 domain-containing protein [Lachnospiraceae bacterium]